MRTARADVVVERAAPAFRWTPFDTAGGTILMGLALTAAIVALLRLLH